MLALLVAEPLVDELAVAGEVVFLAGAGGHLVLAQALGTRSKHVSRYRLLICVCVTNRTTRVGPNSQAMQFIVKYIYNCNYNTFIRQKCNTIV